MCLVDCQSMMLPEVLIVFSKFSFFCFYPGLVFLSFFCSTEIVTKNRVNMSY